MLTWPDITRLSRVRGPEASVLQITASATLISVFALVTHSILTFLANIFT